MSDREKEKYIEQETDKRNWFEDFKHNTSLEIESIHQITWERIGGRDDQRDQAGR